MLVKNPEHRLTASQSLAHQWFSENKCKHDEELDFSNSTEVIESLKQFKETRKVQRIVMSYIASQLTTKEELKEAEAMFRQLDKDKNGQLSRDELIEGLQGLYGDITEQEVDKILQAADTDGSGSIDFAEWKAATSKLTDKKLKSAFAFFDRDGNGSISIQEIKNALGAQDNGPFDDMLWNDLLKDVDKKGDGSLDFKEFKQMMQVLTE